MPTTTQINSSSSILCKSRINSDEFTQKTRVFNEVLSYSNLLSTTMNELYFETKAYKILLDESLTEDDIINIYMLYGSNKKYYYFNSTGIYHLVFNIDKNDVITFKSESSELYLIEGVITLIEHIEQMNIKMIFTKNINRLKYFNSYTITECYLI